MTPAQKALKRSFDFVVSLIGLVLLSPVMLLIFLGIRLTSRGPAVFRQERVGLHGELFRICKFRTMVQRDEAGSTITTATDERVTPFGRFLRRSKLDELPQLWNILRGDMSFVGPRPDVPGYADQLEGENRRILECRPGVTGPGTLFFRDEEELLAGQENPAAYNDNVVFPAKVRLNLEYMESWSFMRDLGYMLITTCPRCNRWLRLVPERDAVLSEEEQNHVQLS